LVRCTVWCRLQRHSRGVLLATPKAFMSAGQPRK
jgi:hypothetical protein